MIKAFVADNDRLRVVGDLAASKDRVVWIDLLGPTKDEEAAVEQLVGIGIPTSCYPARGW